MKRYNVAVVGATGLVGREMVEILQDKDFPIKDLTLLASYRSRGKEMFFHNKPVIVKELKEDSFRNVDIALFSAGAMVSRKFAPVAARAGAIVIDNSSAFRMDKNVPLVVPEVNPKDIKKHSGIIANPNCSTIQLVLVLYPIHKIACIKRVIVATYQSVSGWGKAAVDQLWEETEELYTDYKKGTVSFKVKDYDLKKPIPYQIAFNLVPQVDKFVQGNYTKEEMKMINETKKILADESIRITATCVRTPVLRAHSEVVNLETKEEMDIDEVREILSSTSGVHVVDKPYSSFYPMPADAAGKDGVYVGRIREDITVRNGISMWIVSDNLRKGAALNAVQIAEKLADKNFYE